MILVELCWLDLIQVSKTSTEKFKDEGGRRKVEERGREEKSGGERKEGKREGGRKMGFKWTLTDSVE